MSARIYVLTAMAVLLCCSAQRPRLPRPTPLGPSAHTPTSTTSSPATQVSRGNAGKPVAIDVLTDATSLQSLEAQGFALRELLSAPAFESLARVLENDVELVRRSDPAAGVDLARFSHRLFDVRWLRSATARFELVGIVNRADRAPFHRASCGETRLIYRLAYETRKAGTVQSSRLPMTIGLEFRVPKDETDPQCRNAAERWVVPAAAASVADHLRSNRGPLARSLLRMGADDLLLVVNMQQVRWPSTVRPALAGHAEYLMRAFHFDAEGKVLEPAPLENTPDVERLKADPAALRELKALLRDPATFSEIDQGLLMLPEKFLAKRAISVTPRGLARRNNRPFAQLLQARDFEDLSFEGRRLVRSPEALLRRLDQLSCQGCHATRSIAGFHLLGEDRSDTPAENALAVGVSPHVVSDLTRRRRLHAQALAGLPQDFALPFAERPESGQPGDYGSHCPLGERTSFGNWTCKEGLKCVAYDEPADGMGICLPRDSGHAGDPCEVGTVTVDANGRRDGIRNVEPSSCARNAVCNGNAVGFPGGMCTESCSSLSPHAACGSIAVLDPFNACLARAEPFSACLRNNVRPGGLRSCSADQACRDDYICARAAQGGVCIPPYFLFQLRVDGHK